MLGWDIESGREDMELPGRARLAIFAKYRPVLKWDQRGWPCRSSFQMQGSPDEGRCLLTIIISGRREGLVGFKLTEERSGGGSVGCFLLFPSLLVDGRFFGVGNTHINP